MATRVLFDEQTFLMQERGGISRYFTELICQFDGQPSLGVAPLVPARWVKNEHLALAFPERHHIPPGPLRRRPLLKLANRAFASGSGAADLVHHTHYDERYLGRYRGIPRVCTVYDMIPELMPEAFPLGNPHQAKKRFVQECDAIICISETTKRDLQAVYAVGDKPVVVTNLAVSDQFRPRGSQRMSLPDQYVLFIGQRSGYKNASVLLRSMASLVSSHRDLWLVLVGGGSLTQSEQAEAATLGLTNRLVQLHVPDADLPDVYAGAAAFVFPSRYEGVGLPVLEAFASGAPTLLADTEIFREVAGAESAFFDPDNHEQLAGLIARCLTDPVYRRELASSGSRRLAEYSWERTAQQTSLVYQQLLSGAS